MTGLHRVVPTPRPSQGSPPGEYTNPSEKRMLAALIAAPEDVEFLRVLGMDVVAHSDDGTVFHLTHPETGDWLNTMDVADYATASGIYNTLHGVYCERVKTEQEAATATSSSQTVGVSRTFQ